jgi:hypothetical protein
MPPLKINFIAGLSNTPRSLPIASKLTRHMIKASQHFTTKDFTFQNENRIVFKSTAFTSWGKATKLSR